jgi:hypothetical protein
VQKGEVLWERLIDVQAPLKLEAELPQRFVRARTGPGEGPADGGDDGGDDDVGLDLSGPAGQGAGGGIRTKRTRFLAARYLGAAVGIVSVRGDGC